MEKEKHDKKLNRENKETQIQIRYIKNQDTQENKENIENQESKEMQEEDSHERRILFRTNKRNNTRIKIAAPMKLHPPHQ